MFHARTTVKVITAERNMFISLLQFRSVRDGVSSLHFSSGQDGVSSLQFSSVQDGVRSLQLRSVQDGVRAHWKPQMLPSRFSEVSRTLPLKNVAFKKQFLCSSDCRWTCLVLSRLWFDKFIKKKRKKEALFSSLHTARSLKWESGGNEVEWTWKAEIRRAEFL